MKAEELKQEIKKFWLLAEKLDKYGASDSEPLQMFDWLMRSALRGEPMPHIKLAHWELYESEMGWEDAAIALTEEAERIYVLIQSSPLVEAKKLEPMFA